MLIYTQDLIKDKQFVVIDFQYLFNFRITSAMNFRRPCNLSQSSDGYASLVPKHINLMIKVKHLV